MADCTHPDTDVNGVCYSCGAYVREDDINPAMAAIFPGLYEQVTGRPAFLDADASHPAIAALGALGSMQLHKGEIAAVNHGIDRAEGLSGRVDRQIHWLLAHGATIEELAAGLDTSGDSVEQAAARVSHEPVAIPEAPMPLVVYTKSDGQPQEWREAMRGACAMWGLPQAVDGAAAWYLARGGCRVVMIDTSLDTLDEPGEMALVCPVEASGASSADASLETADPRHSMRPMFAHTSPAELVHLAAIVAGLVSG